MNLNKTFNHLIGTRLDEESLQEQAALKGIRICRIFNTSTDDNGVIQTNENNHYYRSFSRFNIEGRQTYLNLKLPKKLSKFRKKFIEIQEELENELNNPDITESEMRLFISEKLNIGLDEMNDLLETMEKVFEKEFENMDPILERGFLYPWEKIKYKVTQKINLKELPQEKYRGKSLIVQTQGGIIRSVKVKKYTR